MSSSRRDFIRHFGVAMASLMLSRCKPPVVTCYAPAIPTPSVTPPGSGSTSARDRLRGCWAGFDRLAELTQANSEDYTQGEQALQQLTTEHRAALDEMVAAGEISPPVADQVQAAFAAAAHHVWRSHAPITCYEPVLVDYTPTSAQQLTAQAELLEEMAGQADLNPDTVAQVRAAIERDIAFLNLTGQEVQTLYDQLIAAAEASGNYAFPAFDELELTVSPEAAEAARFLVELLMKE